MNLERVGPNHITGHAKVCVPETDSKYRGTKPNHQCTVETDRPSRHASCSMNCDNIVRGSQQTAMVVPREIILQRAVGVWLKMAFTVSANSAVDFLSIVVLVTKQYRKGSLQWLMIGKAIWYAPKDKPQHASALESGQVTWACCCPDDGPTRHHLFLQPSRPRVFFFFLLLLLGARIRHTLSVNDHSRSGT